METLPFAGFPRCIKLASPDIELVATTDVGPHVLHVSRPGGPNLFHVEASRPADPAAWHPYGGHRLWIAPEIEARTYAPANAPVAVERAGETLVLTAPIEAATGLVKSLAITLIPGGVRVLHRIENRGLWDAELAPWALSVMAGGGTAIFPQEPYAPHPTRLTPVRPLVMWSFTDMGDPRWTWGSRYVLLRQEPGNAKRLKVGMLNTLGWMAYARGEELFIKRYDPIPGATYADHGCNVETYTDEQMLELETLGPLVRLAPGQATEHVERWFVSRTPLADLGEPGLDAHLLPAVGRTH